MIQHIKFSLFWSFALLSMVIFVACDNDDDDFQLPEQPDMIEFASTEGNYELLLDALLQSRLSSSIASLSPLTLFAPDDAAFQAYLDAHGWTAIADIPLDTLGDLLTNHIIVGDFRTNTIQTGYYSTLSSIRFNQELASLAYISIDGGIKLNGKALVTNPNNLVQNGVFQGVDQVADPATIVTFVTLDPQFDSLEVALQYAQSDTDLLAELQKEGPYTLFAPNNAAFDTLLATNADWSAIQDIPIDVLVKVLQVHINRTDNYRSFALFNGQSIPSLLPEENLIIDFTSSPEPQVVNKESAAVIETLDIQAENGVIHMINNVLLPENL